MYLGRRKESVHPVIVVFFFVTRVNQIDQVTSSLLQRQRPGMKGVKTMCKEEIG